MGKHCDHHWVTTRTVVKDGKTYEFQVCTKCGADRMVIR